MNGSACGEIIGEADDRPVALELTYHPPLVHLRSHRTAKGEHVALATIDTRHGPATISACVPEAFGLEVARGFRRFLAAALGLPEHHPKVSRKLQTAATMLARPLEHEAATGGFFGDLIAGTAGALAGVGAAILGVPMLSPAIGAATAKLVGKAAEAVSSSSSSAPGATPKAPSARAVPPPVPFAQTAHGRRAARRKKLLELTSAVGPKRAAEAIAIRESAGYAVRRLATKIAAGHALSEMKRQAIALSKDPQIARAVGLETIVLPGPGAAAIALRRAVRLAELERRGDKKALRAVAKLRAQSAAGNDSARRALWILHTVKTSPKIPAR